MNYPLNRAMVNRAGASLRRLPVVRRQRRGVIFITALAIIVILASLALVFAQEMRTEASASAYRLSQSQADAVELGAEQWVLAQTEANPGDAVTITQTPAEAVPVGNGYFWILHPDPTQDQQYKFGITDECGKLSINMGAANSGSQDIANAATEFSYLPGMTQAVADNIVAWVNSSADPQGAPSSTYSTLQEPYQSRDAMFPSTTYESPEELLLVQDMTPQILYGIDLNHNGVIEPAEQAVAGTLAVAGNTSTNDTRGIFNYITCFSKGNGSGSAPNGGAMVSINPVNVNGLIQLLQTAGVSSGSISSIESAVVARAGSGMTTRSFSNITDFYAEVLQPANLPTSQLSQVLASLSQGGKAAVANSAPAVNVNTAPLQVMNCLLWQNQGEAQTIISARAGEANTTDTSWFLQALSPTDLASGILDEVSLSGQSYQYSADIVAVSADGRAFKRVRIVVDSSGMSASATTQTPAQIIYRKNLTSLGWPLDPAIRSVMRSGQPPPDVNSTMNTVTY